MSQEEEEYLVTQNKELKSKVEDLEKQLAWLKRQYFGRKSEKLAHLDPSQLNLFESSLSEQLQEIEAAKEAAEKEIKESTVELKRNVRHARCLKVFLWLKL